MGKDKDQYAASSVIAEARLTVDVVVVAIIGEEHLNRIPRKLVPAMIIHRLGRRHGKENNRLPRRHQSARLRQRRAERVEYEPFQWVVVQGAKGVGNVETVVDRVNMAVEEFVGVKVSVPEVLPAIENEAVWGGVGVRRWWEARV